MELIYYEKENLFTIYNLISNAIKYTQKGGSIKIRVEKDGEKVSLKVSDNGIGISDSDLATIFEPFVKLKEVGHDPASCGLGLYISSYFAELMDGDISVKSEVNSGSTFTLKLLAVEAIEEQNWQAG